MSDIPHFDFPLRFADGKAVEVEQDSIDDIAACVRAILSVERGSFIYLPEFGVPDLVFQTEGVDPVFLRATIEQQEPRVNVAIEEGWDYDDFIQSFRITLKGADVG